LLDRDGHVRTPDRERSAIDKRHMRAEIFSTRQSSRRLAADADFVVDPGFDFPKPQPLSTGKKNNRCHLQIFLGRKDTPHLPRNRAIRLRSIDMKPSNNELSFSAALVTIFLCIIFGANYVAVKIGLGGMGVFTSAALRFAIATSVIALWAYATGRSFSLKKGQAHQIVILGIIFTMQISLFYLGISRTTASHATLVSNFLPFFILFLAHFFIPGDRITIRKFTGILLGFSGILLIFLEKDKGPSDLKTGDIIIFIASFMWACNTVYVKRIINGYRSFQLVLYPMAISVPFFFMEALVWDERMLFDFGPGVLSSLIYQSIITASFGFVAWNKLLKNFGANSLHSFIFIIPIAGVIFGWLLLYEPLTYHIIFALILIASGILVVQLKPVVTPVFPLGRGL